MQCIGIFLFPQTSEVVSIGLVSMVVNNEEPMKIIFRTCFETESTVMEFYVHINNWEPVIEGVLKTCMWVTGGSP